MPINLAALAQKEYTQGSKTGSLGTMLDYLRVKEGGLFSEVGGGTWYQQPGKLHAWDPMRAMAPLPSQISKNLYSLGGSIYGGPGYFANSSGQAVPLLERYAADLPGAIEKYGTSFSGIKALNKSLLEAGRSSATTSLGADFMMAFHRSQWVNLNEMLLGNSGVSVGKRIADIDVALAQYSRSGGKDLLKLKGEVDQQIANLHRSIEGQTVNIGGVERKLSLSGSIKTDKLLKYGMASTMSVADVMFGGGHTYGKGSHQMAKLAALQIGRSGRLGNTIKGLGFNLPKATGAMYGKESSYITRMAGDIYGGERALSGRFAANYGLILGDVGAGGSIATTTALGDSAAIVSQRVGKLALHGKRYDYLTAQLSLGGAPFGTGTGPGMGLSDPRLQIPKELQGPIEAALRGEVPSGMKPHTRSGFLAFDTPVSIDGTKGSVMFGISAPSKEVLNSPADMLRNRVTAEAGKVEVVGMQVQGTNVTLQYKPQPVGTTGLVTPMVGFGGRRLGGVVGGEGALPKGIDILSRGEEFGFSLTKKGIKVGSQGSDFLLASLIQKSDWGKGKQRKASMAAWEKMLPGIGEYQGGTGSGILGYLSKAEHSDSGAMLKTLLKNTPDELKKLGLTSEQVSNLVRVNEAGNLQLAEEAIERVSIGGKDRWLLRGEVETALRAGMFERPKYGSGALKIRLGNQVAIAQQQASSKFAKSAGLTGSYKNILGWMAGTIGRGSSVSWTQGPEDLEAKHLDRKSVRTAKRTAGKAVWKGIGGTEGYRKIGKSGFQKLVAKELKKGTGRFADELASMVEAGGFAPGGEYMEFTKGKAYKSMTTTEFFGKYGGFREYEKMLSAKGPLLSTARSGTALADSFGGALIDLGDDLRYTFDPTGTGEKLLTTNKVYVASLGTIGSASAPEGVYLGGGAGGLGIAKQQTKMLQMLDEYRLDKAAGKQHLGQKLKELQALLASVMSGQIAGMSGKGSMIAEAGSGLSSRTATMLGMDTSRFSGLSKLAEGYGATAETLSIMHKGTMKKMLKGMGYNKAQRKYFLEHGIELMATRDPMKQGMSLGFTHLRAAKGWQNWFGLSKNAIHLSESLVGSMSGDFDLDRFGLMSGKNIQGDLKKIRVAREKGIYTHLGEMHSAGRQKMAMSAALKGAGLEISSIGLAEKKEAALKLMSLKHRGAAGGGQTVGAISNLLSNLTGAGHYMQTGNKTAIADSIKRVSGTGDAAEKLVAGFTSIRNKKNLSVLTGVFENAAFYADLKKLSAGNEAAAGVFDAIFNFRTAQNKITTENLEKSVRAIFTHAETEGFLHPSEALKNIPKMRPGQSAGSAIADAFLPQFKTMLEYHGALSTAGEVESLAMKQLTQGMGLGARAAAGTPSNRVFSQLMNILSGGGETAAAHGVGAEEAAAAWQTLRGNIERSGMNEANRAGTAAANEAIKVGAGTKELLKSIGSGLQTPWGKALMYGGAGIAAIGVGSSIFGSDDEPEPPPMMAPPQMGSPVPPEIQLQNPDPITPNMAAFNRSNGNLARIERPMGHRQVYNVSGRSTNYNDFQAFQNNNMVSGLPPSSSTHLSNDNSTYSREHMNYLAARRMRSSF